MARARNIKPSTFMNETLAECDPLARLLFVGLWTLADREGRLEDRPKKIKAEILPYDNANCDELLNQLSQRRFIIRYIVGESRFIQVVNFTKHQNPHVKEATSTIPAPDSPGASPVQKLPLTDSPFLIPDSPIPSRKMSGRKAPNGYPDDLLAAYHVYPKNPGSKQEAAKSYAKAIKSGCDPALILDGAKRYAEFISITGSFVAHFSTWLNQRRWESDYTLPLGAGPPGTAQFSTKPKFDQQAIINQVFSHDPESA